MKRLILLLTCLVLLAFTTGDPKSEYYLPPLAYSVYSDDIDLDGDNDIVTGHNYYSGWSGVSILLNDSNGYFDFYDTIYLYGGQPDVQIANLNDNPVKEIIAIYEDAQNENIYIAVINDFNTNNISYFSLETYEGFGILSHGDFNGDGYNDIIIASNFFWGVLYNDGTGNFSLPVYYDTEFPIMDIAVGDINGDSIDDILFGGYHLEIHYGTPSGFDYQFLDYYRGKVELFDIDFDGDLDIATNFAFGQTIILLYENTGNNNFILYQQQTLQGTLGSFVVSDFDKDSLGDYMTFEEYALLIFYNKGDFLLQEPESFPISFLAYGRHLMKDLDNNQYEDLIILHNTYSATTIPALHILFNDGNGNFVEDPVTTIINPNKKEQISFSVFPNPVNSQATISFSIKKPAQVNLALFDITGKPVKQILQNTAFTAGKHSVPFKTDNKLQKGIYFIIMDIDNKYNQSIKIIIN